MKAVNLQPRETSRRSMTGLDPLVLVGFLVVLLVLVAVGGIFALERSHARAEQSRLAAARAELAQAQAHQPPPGKAQHALASPAVLAQQSAWQQTLESVLATRVAWDRVLSELSRVVPASVTLSSLSLGSSSSGSPPSLMLSGKASSKLAVTQLLSRLTLVPELEQIELKATATPSTHGHAVTFSVEANVKAAATASSTVGASTTSTTSTTTGGSS